MTNFMDTKSFARIGFAQSFSIKSGIHSNRKLAKSCVCDDDDDVLLLLAKSERISVESASAMSAVFARGRFCLASLLRFAALFPSAQTYTLNKSVSKIFRFAKEENNTR